MKTHQKGWLVLASVFLPTLLSACGNTKVIEKPVPVPVETIIYQPLPPDLLQECNKQPLPDEITYGEALLLWRADRSTLDRCAAQIRAIRKLGDE